MAKLIFIFAIIFTTVSCIDPKAKPNNLKKLKTSSSPSIKIKNKKISTYKDIINLTETLLSINIKFKRPPLSPHLNTVYIVATGDIIPHGAVKQSARLGILGYFKQKPDFTNIFKRIKPLIKNSDIAFANLETPYEPDTLENMYKSIPYKFNIPLTMLKTLKNLGFIIFSIANNHMFDQGSDGIISTIKILDNLHFKYIGANKTYKLAIKPVIIKKKGIKIGFVAFTTWINNDKNQFIPNQKEKNNKKAPYLNRYYKSTAIKTIKELKKQVDFVIVSTHWGHEYHYEPSFEQKRKAKVFINAGADLVLGHHPHVLQPLVYKNGAYIVYSMGNFISNQFFDIKSRHARHKRANREGIIYRFQLIRDSNGKVLIKEINYRPIYIYQEKLMQNPLKLKEPYKIILKQPKKSSKEYQKIIKFIGPLKIETQKLEKLSQQIIEYIIKILN